MALARPLSHMTQRIPYRPNTAPILTNVKFPLYVRFNKLSSLHSYYLENGLFKVEICKDAETVLLSEDVEIEKDYYSQYTRF